jgi:hypothetical protein
MKTISFIISLSVIVLFTFSCGNNENKEKSSEELAEKFVENIVNKTTDNKIDLEINENGETAEMTIEGENGESVTFNVNSKEVPKNFPKDIYIVDGEIETSGTVKTGKGELLSLIIIPKADFNTVSNEITKQMKAKGWNTDMNLNVEGSNMYRFTKAENSATINVTTDGGKTTVSYSVTVELK